jgi:hypothetical protein
LDRSTALVIYVSEKAEDFGLTDFLYVLSLDVLQLEVEDSLCFLTSEDFVADRDLYLL